MMRSRQKGFTLIELMIVVAIIAIISGIAVSAFSGAGDDANRARAQADIAALNDAVGRFYQSQYTYDGIDIDDLRDTAGLTLSPNYDFSINVGADGQTYSVRAIPVAGGEMASDGALAINEVGRRCYFPGDDSPNFTACPHSF